MAILNPCPGSPIKLPLGIRTFSMMRLLVDDALIPSLSSLAPREKPAAFIGTTKAEMPRCLGAQWVNSGEWHSGVFSLRVVFTHFNDLSVVANTIAALDS